MARKFKFDLAGEHTRTMRTQNKIRLAARMFCIVCETETSSKKKILTRVLDVIFIFGKYIEDDIMKHIRREFPDNIQYVCISEDLQSTDVKRKIYIQIITKRRTNKKYCFLDDVTGMHCD